MSDSHEAHDFSHHPDLAHLPSDPALRVKAMESLLLEKGLVHAPRRSPSTLAEPRCLAPLPGTNAAGALTVIQLFRALAFRTDDRPPGRGAHHAR